MEFITKRVLDTRRSRRLLVYLVAAVIPLAITVAGAQMSMPAFVFEHFMVVIAVGLAVVGGVRPAVVSAVAGGIGDNVLLREPIGRPAITGARDAIDLVLFLTVALVVGWLVDRLRIARLRALEAADRERMARQENDRLVATVTHDLATPLNAIQGTIQFARKHATLSEVDLARLLARVETAAARATSLIRALSDTKSIEQQALSLESRKVDMREVVEPIVRMLDSVSDRHSIALAMSSGPLVVKGDVDRLGRVVENLVTNAIKYSPGGGTIEVVVGGDPGSAVLTVRDRGIGIPDDLRGRLFELGYRTPQAASIAPGLGLGLYTASEVVRRHGGTITATSPPGGGTEFTVRLPLAEHPTSTGGLVDFNEVRTSPRTIH